LLGAELSKEMLKYEKARFASWCSSVDSSITAGLQQPLLCRQSSDHGSSSLEPAQTSKVAGGTGSSPGSGGRVVITFPAGLLRLMREAKYLDQLGFAVPQLAVNLALQEGHIR